MWCVGLESTSSGFLLLDVHVQLSSDRVPKWVGKGGGGHWSQEIAVIEPVDRTFSPLGAQTSVTIQAPFSGRLLWWISGFSVLSP